MKRDPNCTLCPLHETAEYVCLLGQGPEPADAMIIGEAPGEREDDTGKPFVGRSGQLLDQIMQEVGLRRQDVYITNAVSCRPPNSRTPTKREINACRHWLNYQLDQVRPKYVMLMGNVPLEAMLGVKGVRKLRGRPIEHEGRIILPTYHPAYILRGDGRERGVLLEDVRTFKAIIDFGGIPEERALNTIIVDTRPKVDAMIDALVGVVSVDIETTGLYPWAPGAQIVTIGFGTRAGEFSLPLFHKDSPWGDKDIEAIIDRIAEAADDCIIVTQNGKFDLLWLKVRYGLTLRNDFDTMLAHHIVDENSPHGLEHLSKTFFGAPSWDIPLTEKQGNAPYATIAKYHAHDLFYTRQLYFTLRAKLKEDPQVLRLFERLVMPAANLFIKMEEHGCYIDTQRMAEVERHLLDTIASSEKRLKKWADIKWSSPKQIAETLYSKSGKFKIKCPIRTKKGAPSTAESALKQIDHPIIADLLEYRGARQQHSFFIEGWRPYVVNHRIHPSFKLHGTVTGRLSSANPNFQQVPRDTLIRSLVSAPPGWTLLEGDLSQIELRIIAEMSRDPSMRHAFNTGVDIHWLTTMREVERGAGLHDLVIDTARTLKQQRDISYSDAIQVLLDAGPDAATDVNKEWKEYRKKAKAINFGYCFSMGWKKFRQYARDNYGIDMSDEDAQQSRIFFFQEYQLERWHNKQSRAARDDGFVKSLIGRKRRLPDAQLRDDCYERAEAWRQAINSPVQGLASDLNLMVLLQLTQEFPRTVFRPVCTVHDSILAEVRDDAALLIAQRAETIMRGPKLLESFGVSFTVPLCGEIKLGPWGSGVSLEKWKAQHDTENAEGVS